MRTSEVGRTNVGVSGPDLFHQAVIGMAYVSFDGDVLGANTALCELLDRESDALLSSNWADHLLPSGSTSWFDEVAPLCTGDVQTLDCNGRALLPDGGLVVVQITYTAITLGSAPALLVQVFDLSNETSALESMIDADRRFKALSTCSSDVILWVRLPPDLACRYASDSLATMAGYSVGEVYANPSLVRQMVHADDCSIIDSVIEVAGNSLSETHTARVRWTRKDGTELWIDDNITVLAWSGGRPTDILHVARDVTAEVDAERERARHDAQRRAVTALSQGSLAADDLAAALDDAVLAVERWSTMDKAAVWWEIEPEGRFRLTAGVGFSDLEVGISLVDASLSHAAAVRANNGGTPFEGPGAFSGTKVGSELDGEGVTSGFGVPIRRSGRVLGVLAAYSPSEQPMSPEDGLFLQSIGNALGACAERVHHVEEIGFLALHDRLTGLPTRARLIDQLKHYLATAEAEDVLVLVMADIDGFGLLNEALGHDVCDQVLIEIAARLQALDGPLIVARTGGDGFGAIVPVAGDFLRVDTLAREAVAVINQPIETAAGPVTVTTSAGVAVGESGQDANDVVASALAALTVAKTKGPGYWEVASGQEHSAALRRLNLVGQLRDDVASESVRAYFQPIACIPSGEIAGFEALARWQSEDGTMVPPVEFIPIAEDTGLIMQLGLSMLGQACRFMESVRSDTPDSKMMVTVNVSPLQLDDPRFPAQAEEVLARYDIPRSELFLELTESALVIDDLPALDRLDALRAIGVRLAIDDFGSGFSSFAYLTQFPIDLLKLDRALVAGMHDDPRREAVVESILLLARTLGITVLAEGVDRPEERDSLAAMDCPLGQGFLWSQAVPAEEALALLGKGAMLCNGIHRRLCDPTCADPLHHPSHRPSALPGAGVIPSALPGAGAA